MAAESPAQALSAAAGSSRYLIHGVIGRGGNGRVHLGTLMGPMGFLRTVAIKRLTSADADDPASVEELLEEARLAAHVRHPHVVPTLDVVVAEDEVFVVLEYVHGVSLAELLRHVAANGSRIPEAIVRAILVGALHGLHAAHEARDPAGRRLGIIHRDVSPQNIMVGSDGIARLLDFGIAKGRGRADRTQVGFVKGKLPYLSPEQLAGAPATLLGDIWGAGVVLWEALTSQRLFAGKSDVQLFEAVCSGMRSPPSALCPGLSAGLDLVVARALAIQPRERFPTANEMAGALASSGPLAQAGEVAAWLDGVLKPVLTARKEAMAQAVSGAGRELSVTRRIELPPPAAEEIATAPPRDPSDTLPARQSQGGRGRSLLGLALLVLLLVALGLAFHEATWERSIVAELPLPQATEERVPAPAAEAPDVESPPLQPPPAGAPLPSARSHPRTGARAKRQAKAADPPATMRPGCTPPYFIDDNGHKRWKLECL